jgi:hypothetical protein
MSESTPFDLLAAKLEAAKAEHMRMLNEQLFADGVGVPVRPLTWRDRVRRRVARVRGYVSTLWRALKGDDPYDVDWDY